MASTAPDAPKVAALIVAAGSGHRAGGDVPKQYRILRGKPMLAQAIDHVRRHDAIDAVQVVIGDGQEADYAEAIGDRALPSPIIGGSRRQDSVRNGLEGLAGAEPPDIVLIHDAARPFCPPDVIDRLLEACGEYDGAIPCLPVTDSLARTDGSSVSRADFVSVQTPQAFRFSAIVDAHRRWPEADEATDDAEIARAASYEIVLVDGDKALKKVTFEDDFAMLQAVVRTGMGFDVHAFGAGDHVMLGGVSIPHDRALKGHSDADAALHALTDAVLGALGAGDIGTHFPPSDPQWRDADSARFLSHARDLAAGQGFSIGHCDVTIICEAPKVGPYRDAMRARIAEILDIAAEAVSVKATTTEGLGFTGRGEGIAAQAIVTLAAQGE